MTPYKTLGILALGLFTAAPAIQAATIYGLTSSNGLIQFDSASPGSVINIGTISQPGIIDLDFFPVNGQLYGMTSTGNTYSIDLATAAATFLFSPLTALSNLTDFDFNPQADRIRIFGDTDQNYRMAPNVTTAPSAAGTAGTVISDGTFTNPAFQLVANAYTNNFDGATSTALYSIDTTTDALVAHTVGPAFSTVAAVGSGLGVSVGSNVGFDIGQDAIAYVNDNNSLYTVDLVTGLATSAGTVGGSGLVSIAVVPEPTSALLGAAGLAFLAARRRRGV